MRATRWGVLLLALVGVVSAAVALRDEIDLPSPEALAGATVLSIAGISAAAQSWVNLVDESEHAARRGLREAFLFSQPSKYLPGGAVVQAGGQVGLATSSSTLTAAGAASFVVTHAAVQLSAALAVGSLYGLFDQTWPRVLAVGAVIPAFLLIHRPSIALVLRVTSRLVSRWRDSIQLPSQAALLQSFAWATVPIAAAGLAFYLLLPDTSGSGLPQAFTGFALAWAAGFVVVLVPGGVGIREAALVGLVATDAADVLVAGVGVRAAMLCAEVLAVAGMMTWEAIRRTR